MAVIFRIALQNLLQAKRRTALLSLAIGLVTMLLVLLLAVSQGIEDNLVRAATTVSAGHVNVAGFYKPTAGSARPIVTEMSKVRAVVEANTPGLAYVVDRHRGWAKVVSDTASMQAGLSGIRAENEARFFDTLEMALESEYKTGGRDVVVGDARRLSEPRSTLLFASQAKRLGVNVGDLVTIQTETLGGLTNTMDVTVVAIAKDLGLLSSWSVFVSTADILELYQMNEDTTGAIWVYLDDIEQADAVMGTLRVALENAGYTLMDHQPAPFFFKFEQVAGEDWTGQRLDLTTWSDEVSFLTWVLTAFDSLSWFLVTILVVIIAVGIMNTMWNSVRERTREIGTMRAIGMSGGRVLVMFLTEATLLGVFATTVGAVGGAVLAAVVDAADIKVPIDAVKFILLSERLNLSVRPSALISAVVALTAFTVLASAWPAVRAGRLSPITALGHVE